MGRRRMIKRKLHSPPLAKTPRSTDNMQPAAESNEEVSPQKQKYSPMYSAVWELDEQLKGWLAPVKNDAHAAYCNYCQSKVVANYKALCLHATTQKHMKNTPVKEMNDDLLNIQPKHKSPVISSRPNARLVQKRSRNSPVNVMDDDYEDDDDDDDDDEDDDLSDTSQPKSKSCSKFSRVNARSTQKRLKSSSFNDIYDPIEAPQTKRSYVQKYTAAWENEKALKDWVAPVPGDVFSAYCRFCRSSLVAHLKSLQHHASTKKHLKNIPLISNLAVDPIGIRRKSRELEIAALVACRLPIDSVDELGDVLARGFCDTGFRMHRAKCTALVVSVLAPHFRGQLRQDLTNAKHFSLYLRKPMDGFYCLAVKYFSEELAEMTTTFLRFVEITPDSPAATVLAIKTVLLDYGLNLQRLVGLAGDVTDLGHVAVALLKKEVPDVVLISCTYLSLDRVAMRAMSELPDSLEFMIRESHNWFTEGELVHTQLYDQVFGDLPDSSFDVQNADGDWRESGRRVSRSANRWLVRAAVVDRMLTHYDALTLHFDSIERCHTARLLGDMYLDPINHAYLVFLQPLLTELSRLELLHRSETGNLFHSHEQLESFVVESCRRIIKPTIFRFKSSNDSLLDLDSGELESVCLSVDGVDFGLPLIDELKTAETPDKDNVLTACYQFLKTVITECTIRISDGRKLINKMSAMQPANFRDDTFALRQLPDKLFGCDGDTFEEELRALSAVEWSNWYDLNTFWTDVHQYRNDTGVHPFPNLSRGVMKLLTLPVSDAEVERVFRQVDSLRRTKCSRDEMLLLAAVLSVKYGLRRTGTKYSEFVPPKELLRSYESRMYD